MIGETLSHYEIVAKLGEGGMGEVYLAEDTRLKRRVALKIMPPEIASDPERQARFRREAETVAALNHPNIVTIHSIERANGRDFLTMELVEGETLDQQVALGGLGVESLFDLAVPITDALAEAHTNGIAHRDLKPANVMVTSKGQVKVLDFGLAKLTETSLDGGGEESATLTREGMVVGTVRYMSPEQAKGEPADQRSDVFSLGVLLYEMATGQRPFRGNNSVELLSSILKDEPPSVTQLRNELPNHLGRIIRRCLEKDPDKRYQTALEVRNELQDLRAELGLGASQTVEVRPGRSRPGGVRRWQWVAGALLGVTVTAWWALRARDTSQAQQPATLAELQLLVDDEKYPEAFMLHRELTARLAKRPESVGALDQASQIATIRTVPEGATISIRPYGGEWPWLELGATPLQAVRVPLGFLSVKIETEGSEPYQLATAIREQTEWHLPSPPVPEGMTWVPEGRVAASSLSPTLPAEPVEIPGFYIDRFEVTNREYSEFVDAGGYRKAKLWAPFVRDGESVSWEQGLAELVDSTGRPAPAGWELATFPHGEGALPVTGISWFEAAAFAEWQGKALPTVYHWLRTAELSASAYIVPASNFGDVLLPASGERGLGVWGTHDLAGNAKEWSRSQTRTGRRFLFGGAWNEPSYNYFTGYDERSPWDRSVDFGFRCVRELEQEKVVTAIDRPIELLAGWEPSSSVPADDATFEIYRSLHEYERRPLEPEEGALDDSSPYWTRLDVTIDAGHGRQRLPVMLFLPKTGEPPYQVAVLFAGANALSLSSSADAEGLTSFDAVDFLIRSGRAVAVPVLLGMYERQDGYDALTHKPIEDRDHFLAWSKEVRRTVDYLVGRSDVDPDRILYVGSSLGAMAGPVILALDSRFSAAYLRLAGLFPRELPAEVDPLNFAPRVNVPILMLNGRYDRLAPVETAQQGLLRVLGTSEDEKKLILFDVGHAAPRPRNRAIREVLGWADRVLGPVGQ